jgi:hypothetical protein
VSKTKSVPDVTTKYRQFIAGKSQRTQLHGFRKAWLPDCMKPFQSHATEWAVRKGRGALFADCGLGKSLMTLVFGQNVVKNTNQPFLIATPIAVGRQIIAEAGKFGMEASRLRDGAQPTKAGLYVTNYEQLHHLNPGDFAGVACDESQILKNFDGKTKRALIEFLRPTQYRLLCTATPSPNDYDELGNSSEAIGEMGYHDMVSRFFVKETKKDTLGWGRTSYRLRTHAQADFWRWVCSWSLAFRKPSDLGFSDDGYTLPELEVVEHEVKATIVAAGRLFDVPAESLQEQREEQRRTLKDRCERVAQLVEHDDPSVIWCHLNDEADLITKLVSGAVQVSGQDSDEAKEEKFLAFTAGQIRKFVIKPKIGALGMNWQHCAHQTFFPSHSFEQFYQGLRRCWRFGQTRKVRADIVNTEGGAKVMASYRRKSEQADRMFAELVANMNNSLAIQVETYGQRKGALPQWM